MCANAENKHALRARLCKANADRDGQRAVHEHRQRGERPAVRCGGYCGKHKARPAGKHRLFSGDCGLSKLAETLFRLQKDWCYARPRRCGAFADAAGRVPGNRRAFHGDFAAPWHFGAVRLRRRLLRYGLGSTRVERGMGAERRMAPGRFHIRPAPQNDAEHVYAARRSSLSRAAPLGRSSAKPRAVSKCAGPRKPPAS